MSLTDKEIALELTKAYIEHLNTIVNINGMHSDSNLQSIAKCYQHFYNVVSEVHKTKE